MEVTGPGSGGGDSPVRPTESLANELLPIEAATPVAPDSETSPDEADVSETARIAERPGDESDLDESDLDESDLDESDLRAKRLARIQAEIAAGTYDTDDKLETAVERLLREIG